MQTSPTGASLVVQWLFRESLPKDIQQSPPLHSRIYSQQLFFWFSHILLCLTLCGQILSVLHVGNPWCQQCTRLICICMFFSKQHNEVQHQLWNLIRTRSPNCPKTTNCHNIHTLAPRLPNKACTLQISDFSVLVTYLQLAESMLASAIGITSWNDCLSMPIIYKTYYSNWRARAWPNAKRWNSMDHL